MFNRSKDKSHLRPTALLIVPLLTALFFLWCYPELWLVIGVGLIAFWIVTSVLAVTLDLKIKPDLQHFLDIYLKNIELTSSDSFVHGKLQLGRKDYFMSVRCDSDGIILLYSGKAYGVLRWSDIWEIRKVEGRANCAEVVLVSKPEYNGVRRLILAWNSEFWNYVPKLKQRE